MEKRYTWIISASQEVAVCVETGMALRVDYYLPVSGEKPKDIRVVVTHVSTGDGYYIGDFDSLENAKAAVVAIVMRTLPREVIRAGELPGVVKGARR